jgi:hypothetical protein
MRTTQFMFALSSLLISGALLAEEGNPTPEMSSEVQRSREMVQEFRTETIRSEMHFTEQEAADFWPLYEQYRASHLEVMDRLAAQVAEYLRRYNDADLTNAYADQMIKEHFDIQRSLLKVQEKYLPKFRKILPAMQVARFYQLENKLNADINAQLALTVPLIDPS